MTFKYTVAMMDTVSENDMDDVVKTLHYRITMTDLDAPEGTLIPFKYGTVDLDSPDAESFIEFSNISEATAEAWLKSKLNCDYLEDSLKQEFEANRVMALNPVPQKTSKMPVWATEQQIGE